MQSHYIRTHIPNLKAFQNLPLAVTLATLACFFSSFSAALAFPFTYLGAAFLGGIISSQIDSFLKIY